MTPDPKRAELARSSLKRFSYKEREMIKLRYGLGDGHVYKQTEIAAIFKLSIGKVRSRFAKIEARLDTIASRQTEQTEPI